MIHFSSEDIVAIASSLKKGEVVALPTETVYGLAICLDSAKALEKLIFLKRRDLDSGKVFTLVPENRSAFSRYATVTKAASRLISAHVPGELTLILKKNPDFSHPYFDHFLTVGLRIPAHPLFPPLLKLTGPLLLTSANPRGDTPAPDSATVEKILPKVDAVVDGISGGHAPSTIVSFASGSPVIVREGDLHLQF